MTSIRSVTVKPTSPGSAARSQSTLRAHEHGLDVDELAYPVGCAFAAIAAVLHAPEWQARIGTHILVHEPHARRKLLGRDPFAPGEVARNHARAQAEARVVRNEDRVRFVLRLNHGRHGPEHL